jgi:predicted permease
MAQRFGPADVPQLQDLSLNAPAVLFTVVLSLATTAFFGIAPAWRLSSISPQESLKQAAQVGASRGSQKLQNALVISEIALALVLLIGGSLLLQSFARLLNVPLGFRPDGVVVARTLFDWGRYPDLLKREAVQKELLTHLATLPGVTAAAAASHLPLSDARQIGFRLEHAAEDDYHWAENSMVTPGYFGAMGIRLLRGRDFIAQDGRQSANVAIVNEAFARENFTGRDPIGQRFYWGGRSIFTIVGVASDVRISALDADPQPMIYYSMFQVENGAGAMAFVLRVARERENAQQGMLRAIQQQLWAIDKQLPLYGTTTLNTLLTESVAQRRFAMLLLSGFAAVALLLASVGLFGVVSYVVSQRRRELAMRMALGADSVRIGRLVLKQAAQLAFAGCAIGLGLFSLSSSLFAASLYNTKRFDPLTLTAVSLLLFSVAMFAAYWPARRAMRMEPLVILRYE